MKKLKALQQGLLSCFICFLLLLSTQDLRSSHAAGGTITYECVGNGQYSFKIIMFRDESGIPLPNTMTLRFDPVDGSPEIDKTVEITSENSIPTVQVHPCHDPPVVPSLTYSEVIYESDTIALPSGSAYDVYNVVGPTTGICCRNPEIINIANPGTQAQVLYSRIPDPGTYPCNNAPTFDTLPPVELCKGIPVSIDQSATDADGDSLSYSFCNALDQGSYSPPAIPPFPSVPYASGHSGTEPVPGNPALSIDSITGEITGTPTQIGTYVINVCIEEHRNDTLIGRYAREIQVKSLNCVPYEANINTGPGDTIISCDMTVGFESNSGANSHLWQFDYPSGTDTSGQENPTYTYPDTGTYTVMYVAEADEPCSDTTFATVVIMDSASASHQFLSVSTSADEICPYDTVQLNASGADQYQWLAPSFSFPCDTCAYNMRILDTTTEFIVKGMKNGCANYDTTTIEVREPSGLFASDTVEVCAGDSIQLSANYGNNLEWDSSPDLSCNQCPAPYAYPATGTWFYVSGTDTFGCESFDSVYVGVKPNPALAIIPSDTSICRGGVATLEAQTGAMSYTWSNGDTSAFTEVGPSFTTDYAVTVTGSNNCTASDTATVTVNVLQSGSFINDTAICAGDSVELFVNGFTSAQWSPGHSLSDSTSMQPMAFPDTTTTYTVVVADINGCNDTGTVTVTVNPEPDITTSPDTFYCPQEDTVILQASGAQSYQWEPASQLFPDTGATAIVGVFDPSVASVTYTVTGTTAEGCSDTGQVTLTYGWPDVDLQPDTAQICLGETVKLVATGAESYQWIPAPGIPPQHDDTLVIGPASTTNFTVVGTDSLGCTDTDQALVEVDEYADVYGQITHSNGVPLTNTKVYLIQYDPNDSSVTALDSTFTDDTTGHYHFETQEPEVYVKVAPDSASYPNEMPTYYDSSLTWNNAAKITLQDCDSVEANFSTIAGNNPGGPGFISGKLSEGAGKHLWSGEPIAGATLFLMNEAGEPVTYAVTDGDGWFVMEDLAIGEYTLMGDIPHLRNEEAPAIEITNELSVLDSLVVKEVDNKLEISNFPTGLHKQAESALKIGIHPNPADERAHVRLRNADGNAKILIYNNTGQLVKVIAPRQQQVELDTGRFPAGLYFIKVRDEKNQLIKKMQIVH